MEMCKQQSDIEMRHLPAISINGFVGGRQIYALWALEWAGHPAETNLRCVKSSGIYIPNPNFLAFVVAEISAFIRTDGHTDMSRSTRLVILIKNKYTLWGWKAFYVTYFPTNLVYPFTPRVTGIKITPTLRGYIRSLSKKKRKVWILLGM